MTSLNRYPRPNVAIDVAVLTALPAEDPRAGVGQLAVLVQEQPAMDSGPALPGRFLRQGETIADCVATALAEKVGLTTEHVAPKLLRVFDAPDRDPRGWTISLAHYLALPFEQLADARGELVPIDLEGRLVSRSGLLFDHDAIVTEAAAHIRDRYEHEPDPDRLLSGSFTLADLKSLHEAVLGERLRRDTFRRRMEPLLESENDEAGQPVTRVDGGRPARLWRVPAVATLPVSRINLPREARR